jgi:hypothetical protein
MPISKLNIRPGANTQLSPTANDGGWSLTNLVRFRDGLPQKFAGWQRYLTSAVKGVTRAIWTWQQLDASVDIAFGTHSALMLAQGGALFDITPFRHESSPAGPFTTVSGSKTVTVADTANGSNPGDTVLISSALDVGGITLFGYYTVVSAINNNSYTILAASAATSGATGGGTPLLQYVLPGGNQSSINSNGFGVGPYGAGSYGTPRTSSLLTLKLRQWSLSNWGELLLACLRYGHLYVWGTDLSQRAVEVVNATPAFGPPKTIQAMFIGMPERHCILLGTSALNDTTSFDPMLVRFSDVETYDTYNATALNSAGSFRLQGGTQLICGLNITNQSLIWSDAAVFSMRFIGLPYVYGFDRLATGCGIVGPHAMVEQSGAVFWMGISAFYMFSGGAPTTIPCPVWQTVFSTFQQTSIDLIQGDKVYCGVDAGNNEVLWFYQSIGGDNTSDCDRYVAYNYVEQTWHFGMMARTAWVDRGITQEILATSPTGIVYQQGIGEDADGVAMDAYCETGYVDISDGTEYMFVDKIIPDFGLDQMGTVYLTMKSVNFPNKPPVVSGPFAMTPDTEYQTVRVRARQVAFRFEAKDLGAYFRLGAVRVQAAMDGRN